MAEETTQSGSNTNLYIGIGFLTLLLAGGGTFIWWQKRQEQLQKEKEEKQAAIAAIAMAAQVKAEEPKVPLKKDGKTIFDKDGNPILVPVSEVIAGKPILGEDGQPVKDKDGNVIVLTSSDANTVKEQGKNKEEEIAAAAAAAKEAEIRKDPTKLTGDNPYINGDEILKRLDDTSAKPYSGTTPSDGVTFRNKIKEVGKIEPIIYLTAKLHKPLSKLSKIEKSHPAYKKLKKEAEERAEKLTTDLADYVIALFKGMNLEVNATNIGKYQSAIGMYLNSPSKVKESSIKVGEMLGKDYMDSLAKGNSLRAAANTAAKAGKMETDKTTTDRPSAKSERFEAGKKQ